MRRHFGIGYREARHDLPRWEVDLLLEGLAVELEAGQVEDVGLDDLDVPDDEPPRAEVGRRFTLTTEEVID